MYRMIFISLFLFVSHVAYGEETIDVTEDVENSSNADVRQFVSMPDKARALMRKDMLDNLSALSEILGYLALNDFTAAADVAENKMGRSSMGKHRAAGERPGNFMPKEMRSLGWAMHDAATEFAKIAEQGDVKSTYSALQKVTNSCVACHYSYRTQ